MEFSLQDEDTIVAPITGRGAVQLFRVSGPLTRHVLETLFTAADTAFARPRELVMGTLDDALSPSESLDQVLVAYFPAPRSFTGEEVAEIGLHGSPYLAERLLQNLQHLGVRLAEPGEFTRRAFLNGRLDLSQAEAVGDLIMAETEAQARIARAQLEGRLSQAVSALGEPLRAMLAEIEAWIDFPEDDISPATREEWRESLEQVRAALQRYLESFRTGRLVREGAQVALAGRPNAGKSSLLNRLVGEERAIVTATPGTTRDLIEERISLEGVPVRLWDTAGLVDAATADRSVEEAEALGVERSWRQLQQSECVLYVIDLAQWSDEEDQHALLAQVASRSARLILVANKADLLSPEQVKIRLAACAQRHSGPVVAVSAQTGEGLDALRSALCAELFASPPSGSLVITNRRHQEALERARGEVEEALRAVHNGEPPEVVSLAARAALGHLSDIIGVTHTEEILGRIFTKFCIGK